MTAREELAFRQMADKCNAALADNAVLVIEVNDLRRELANAYRDISSLKFELRKAISAESVDLFDGLSRPLEFEPVLKEEIKKEDKKIRKIPVPKVPKSVKTSKVPKKNNEP